MAKIMKMVQEWLKTGNTAVAKGLLSTSIPPALGVIYVLMFRPLLF